MRSYGSVRGALGDGCPYRDHYLKQRGRLIANVVIAYNSMLLSGLLGRCLAAGNEKALNLLRRISPAAWQHLHFLRHYDFRGKHNPIDLEAVLAVIDWE